MSYDKKLNADTISWPGLDYGTHSTENANYVTLERSRLSETERRTKVQQSELQLRWQKQGGLGGIADGLAAASNSCACALTMYRGDETALGRASISSLQAPLHNFQPSLIF